MGLDFGVVVCLFCWVSCGFVVCFDMLVAGLVDCGCGWVVQVGCSFAFCMFYCGWIADCALRLVCWVCLLGWVLV